MWHFVFNLGVKWLKDQVLSKKRKKEKKILIHKMFYVCASLLRLELSYQCLCCFVLLFLIKQHFK